MMTQFGDMRGWIEALRKEGELHQIDTEVDWDCELGTITRRAFGNGDGPALLFSNIKDYNKNATRCSAMFTGGLSNYSRVAMMFGLPKDASITDLVKTARKAYASRVPPVVVKTGPVKENILKGDDINLFDFPVPRWHRRRRPLHQHHAGLGDARPGVRPHECRHLSRHDRPKGHHPCAAVAAAELGPRHAEAC